MLYFAYGSNLDWQRMLGRCPSARFVCVATLPKHAFAFTRKCQKGYGVMDIKPDDSAEVWGVVYEIDEIDVERLDKAEGYRPGRSDGENAYRRVERMVFGDGCEEKPYAVCTYEVVTKSKKHIPPSQEYKNLVVDGAKRWQLPADYQAQLETIETE